MTIMEIALLVIGVIIFVISFLLPDSNEKKTEKEIAAEKEEARHLLEQELDGMKLKVNEATNDTVEYAVDKAERSLERVSNEKIMAVNEYAGTIIEEINKNHKEVMFLYDMLRDKHADLTNAVRKADATVKEIEHVSHTAQTASETLLRGMSVASVSQKGLTQEQKSVFDDIMIPDAEPVVFKEKQEAPMVVQSVATSEKVAEAPSVKPRGVALAQSKIFAGLTGEPMPSVESTQITEKVESSPVEVAPVEPVKAKREAVTYDLLSGSAYKDGSIVGIEAPTGKAVTSADYAAMVRDSGPISQAPANNNDKIIELSKQGLSTLEIAKTLNLGVGEVKLVIDLFK